MPAFWANASGFVLASSLSYAGHRTVTFRCRTRHGIVLGRFAAQSAASWLVTTACAVALMPALGAWPTSAIIMVLVPMLNFLVYARWTFR